MTMLEHRDHVLWAHFSNSFIVRQSISNLYIIHHPSQTSHSLFVEKHDTEISMDTRKGTPNEEENTHTSKPTHLCEETEMNRAKVFSIHSMLPLQFYRLNETNRS